MGAQACGDDSGPSDPAADDVAGSGAADVDSGAADIGEVTASYSDVFPIFVNKCIWCHHPDNGVDVDLTVPFDSEVGIINRPNTWLDAPSTLLVEPGNPDNSFLMDKIERLDLDEHVEGFPMPWQIPRLAPDEVATIRQWISDGANNDAFYADSVAPIFGDGISLGTDGGNCAYCHYPGATTLPDLTNSFDPLRGVVDVMGRFGVIMVIPGDPDGSLLVQKIENATLDAALGLAMPYWPERLTETEVDNIRRWIEAGAPED